MTRRRRALVIAGVALTLSAYLTWGAYVRYGRESVQTNTLVGRSEAEIRGNYGHPVRELDGYQALALYVPLSLPSGSIRTLIFHPRGLFHPEGGTLCVWVTEQDGDWMCFESCWFAAGVVF